jgi:hypothetical protein
MLDTDRGCKGGQSTTLAWGYLPLWQAKNHFGTGVFGTGGFAATWRFDTTFLHS